MRKLFFILLLVFLCQGQAISQPTNPGLEVTRSQFHAQQVIPPSPEAAELGKYGNVPVSLFTGTPNISIPLVELKGKFLSLPASLSYNHMGFKPDEIAPWTGLGWALQAGGVITRSAMGEPDMVDNYFRVFSPLRPVPNGELQKQLYYDSVRNRILEPQGDVYYYNFMGKSGKFMILPDYTIIKKEKNYLKIVLEGSIESDFVITDEEGIKYEFRAWERTEINPVDDQPNAPPLVARNFISAWYLSKVIAPNGMEELEFEYYSPTYSQATMGGSLANNSITYTKREWGAMPPDPNVNWYNVPPAGTTYTFQHPVTAIWKKFLKKATLRKNNVIIGYIDFESDLNARVDLGAADFDGERMLKKVKLYNTTNSVNTLVKEFVLGYGYFGLHQTESPGYRRLKLKTIREMSTDSVATPNKPPYTLYYNGESSDMPKRFISGLDHWGFFNGQINEYNSVPTLIPTVHVSGMDWVTGYWGLGANREAGSEASELAILERIDYPTGGYTTFDYEGNTGALLMGTPQPVGGLRIKEMIDHSFTNKAAVVKKYEYNKEDGSTSGQIAYYPSYWSTSLWEDFTGCPWNIARVIRTWSATISANSSIGLGSIQGSHIGYNRVTEYQTDLATSKPLGKTVYAYDIQSSNEIDSHIGNGELLKQQVFDNGDKLLEELTNVYTYEEFQNQRGVARKLLTQSILSDQSILAMKIVGTDTFYMYHSPMACHNLPPGYGAYMTISTQNDYVENYMPQQRKKLTQQVRKVYNDIYNNYLTYTKNLTYANSDHNFPTLIEELDSKSEKVFTSIKYVADYTINCSPPEQAGSAAAAIKEMQEKNMKGVMVEKLQYREDAGGGNRRYLSGEFTQHKRGLAEKIYYLQASPMPTSVTASQASCFSASQSIDNNYRLVATLTYDTFMNLREESKTDDAVTTYFWGYDNRYPVAKITGKTLTESLTSGISQAVLDNPSSESALRTELYKLRFLSGAIVTTFTYKPMIGMISAKDPRGQLLVYEYDQLNRLVHIKDSNEIIKNFRYNYGLGTAPTTSAQSIYYNAATQTTLTKQGCSPLYGDDVIYKVPYGKYAAISQAAADALAAADITANGQNYANATGQCIYKSALTSQMVYKATCTYEQGPPVGVMYIVPFGKYKSTISQAHANGFATAEITAMGQAYANLNDVCSCIDEGKKYINGNCETGAKINAGSSFENGQWVCSYYYLWSDSSTSGYYYTYQSEPCPIDP